MFCPFWNNSAIILKNTTFGVFLERLGTFADFSCNRLKIIIFAAIVNKKIYMENLPIHPLVREILDNGLTLGWFEYAEMFDIKPDGNREQRRKAAFDIWKNYTRRHENRNLPPPPDRRQAAAKNQLPPSATTSNDKQGNHFKTEKDDEILTETFSEKLYTVDEMAAFHKIDMTVWEPAAIITNYWEVGAKLGNQSSGFFVATTPLHQLKVTWRRIKDNIKNIKELLLSQIALPEFVPLKIKSRGDLSAEIMITDHHFGKVGFNPETMDFNWTLKEAGKAYNDAVDFFLSQLDLSQVAEFVLPTGNDLLNIDSNANTTTKGTPQMTGDFWASVFRYGKETVIAVIEKLSKIAPVYVYFIPGNHDRNSTFGLGEAVAAYFAGNPNVFVTNNIVKRCYHSFGANLIGYAHGDGLKAKEVYKAMSLDEPQRFGAAKFKSFHLGHLHQNKINKVIDLEFKSEVNGIDVEICPSLSPVDEWHYHNLYIGNLRRSKCFLRHKERGLVGEFYFNL